MTEKEEDTILGEQTKAQNHTVKRKGRENKAHPMKKENKERERERRVEDEDQNEKKDKNAKEKRNVRIPSAKSMWFLAKGGKHRGRDVIMAV